MKPNLRAVRLITMVARKISVVVSSVKVIQIVQSIILKAPSHESVQIVPKLNRSWNSL